MRKSLPTIMALLSFTAVALASEQVRENSGNQIRTIPEDLYQYITTRGCKQIESFYKNYPYVRTPPYLYGVLDRPENAWDPASPDETAAVFCERPGSDFRQYRIVLKLNGRSWP